MGNAEVCRCVPKRGRRATTTQRPTQADTTKKGGNLSVHARESPTAAMLAPPVCLLALPVELLVEILSSLSVRSLAATDSVCASLHAMVRCDHLWARLYRRDFGRTSAPDEHTDAASYGRRFRWLYVLEVARQRRHPVYLANGRYIGVVPSSDGTTYESGEWAVAFDGQNSTPRLVLDGYATATYVKEDAVKKEAHDVDPTIRSREGLWRAGAFVGPGRVVSHISNQFRAERFGPRGIDGHGEATYGNDRYIGLFNGLQRHGRGTFVRPADYQVYAEWASNERDGRGIWTRTKATQQESYAGQFVGGRYVGSGVRRGADDSIKQSIWAGFDKPSVYSVERKPYSDASSDRGAVSVVRIVRPESDGWRLDYVNARGHVLTRTKDAARITAAASTDVVIGGPAYVVLIAIGDARESRLAGRRIWGHKWTASPDTQRRDFATLPADLHSQGARLWAAYLTSSHCLVRPDVAADCVRALTERAADAEVSLDWRSPEDDIDPATLGLGLPFGEALPAKVDDDDDQEAACASRKEPRVRCFLTGALVHATDCDFVSSGRLYARDSLATWYCVAGPHRNTDPETGTDLCAGRDWKMPWCVWMSNVPPRLLAWAVRDTAARHPLWSVAGRERVRAIVADVTGALDKRQTAIDPWTTLASGESLAAPGPTDGRMLAGFDGLVIKNVEVRHHAWDPRGPWRLGAPVDPPVDPTLQPFEADDRDPSPTAYLASHGVVVADVGVASFLGSRLTAVHFFGQRFEGASFAGASLTACVFVDCQFRGTAFFDAFTGGGCVFHNCLVDRGADAEPMSQDGIIERIRSVGVL